MGSDEFIKEFIESIPEEMWIDLAHYHKNELKSICNALTLDLYFIENESISNR